ncbi:hypothetical protein HDU93_009876, partial [Gonapodya sp. JEL0774]
IRSRHLRTPQPSPRLRSSMGLSSCSHSIVLFRSPPPSRSPLIWIQTIDLTLRRPISLCRTS